MEMVVGIEAEAPTQTSGAETTGNGKSAGAFVPRLSLSQVLKEDPAGPSAPQKLERESQVLEAYCTALSEGKGESPEETFALLLSRRFLFNGDGAGGAGAADRDSVPVLLHKLRVYQLTRIFMRDDRNRKRFLETKGCLWHLVVQFNRLARDYVVSLRTVE